MEDTVKSILHLVSGILVMTILFACSCKTNTIDEVTSSEVTVSWKAPTTFLDGRPIPPEHEIRYELFIDLDQDNTHDDKHLLTDFPISEPTYTTQKIEKLRKEYHLEKGHYFLGLRAILFQEGKPVQPVNQSEIIWSSSETDTGHKPFGVDIN